MTLKSPFEVIIEQPELPIAEIMGAIRTWLDHNKIEPIDFKTLPVDGEWLALEIRFKREDEAVLFDRAFA